ncbi:hypothetical protein JXVLWARM_CDS_0048 [Burkholderia phage Bm1]
MLKFSRTAASQRLCRMDLDNRMAEDRMVGFGLKLAAVAVFLILVFDKVPS